MSDDLDLAGLVLGEVDDAVMRQVDLTLPDTKCHFSPDPRTEGADRFGIPYAEKQLCGDGYGPGEVCPLYVEESCPGCRNKRAMDAPCSLRICSGSCGTCGGGGHSRTYATCGQPHKSPQLRDLAIAEFGGSMRTDQWWCEPTAMPRDYPVDYIPGIEWGAKAWMADLNAAWEKRSGQAHYPALVTSAKSVYPGRNKPRPQLLRERLNFPDGMLITHGLTKDDLLDNVWDDRRRYIDFMRQSEVDICFTPEFSGYSGTQLFMTVYNMNRAFRFYCEMVEAGIPHVGLDISPPISTDWVQDDYLEFIHRNGVKVYLHSMQLWRSDATFAKYLVPFRRYVQQLPEDSTLFLVGPSAPNRIATLARVVQPRRVVFSTKEAFARAAFFELMPQGAKAPPGMTSGQVFAHNVLSMERLVRASTKGLGNRSAIGDRNHG